MCPIHQSETLRKLYERKLAQLRKASEGQNLMLRLILEAEVQALADQLGVASHAH